MAAISKQLPIEILNQYSLKGKKPGLVIIDEVNGFCKPGCGNLAPANLDPVIDKMISLTDDLAKKWPRGTPIFIFQDTHEPNIPEPPYPAHCVKGSGEENLVKELSWLTKRKKTRIRVIKKNCINGYIGAQGRSINEFELFMMGFDTLVVTGICTDICVLQFVQTVLSARNHQGKNGNNGNLLRDLKDVVVYTEACATYDLPAAVVKKLGLPKTATHPRELTQHMGLWLMQQSGAILAKKIVL